VASFRLFGLLAPMGMAMGHGMMPNVPIGVPPPAMQGLLMPPAGQMMHQQMIGGVPQPVNSPFSAARKFPLCNRLLKKNRNETGYHQQK
jgi:hypothetical protein